MTRSLFVRMVVSGSVVLVVACSSADTVLPWAPVPAHVTVVAPDAITQNDVVQLHAVVTNLEGDSLSGIPVRWSTSDTTLVSLDDSGAVTALRPGTAHIVARVDSISGAVALSVQPATVFRVIGLSFDVPLWPRDWASAGVPVPEDAWGHQIRDLPVDVRARDTTIVTVLRNPDGMVRLHGLQAGQTMLDVRSGAFRDSGVVVVRSDTSTVDILAVNGVTAAGRDTLVIAGDSLHIHFQVAVPPSRTLLRSANVLASEGGLQWSTLDLGAPPVEGVQPGETKAFDFPVAGRVFGTMELQIQAFNFPTNTWTTSPPVELRSATPFYDVHIAQINGATVTGNAPVPVADSFATVLQVATPAGAPPLARFWLDAKFDDGTGTTLGASQDGAFSLPAGTSFVSMVAYHVPRGTYRVYPIALVAPEQVWMSPTTVTATNSDSTPPSVSLVGPRDADTVSTDDPAISVDFTDSQSGVNGAGYLLDWPIDLGSETDDWCRYERIGFGNGLSQRLQALRFTFHPSECFGHVLRAGENPITVWGVDNADNRDSTSFTLFYVPGSTATTAGSVRAPPAGALLLRAASLDSGRTIVSEPNRRVVQGKNGTVTTVRRLRKR